MTSRPLAPRTAAGPGAGADPDAGPRRGAVFPGPTRSFAGRRAELDRLVAHVDHEVLFVVNGVGGIGKTELVYQLFAELASRPPWDQARPLLVQARPGIGAPRLLAQLLAALGEAPPPRRGQPSEKAHLEEQLDQLAGAVDARPHLLFVDDAHHLPAEELGDTLAYLARRLRRSRLFVASRRELRLPAGAPPPVVTTLGPLDAGDAAQLAAALADRLQLAAPGAELLRGAHGSPFQIHRLLVPRGARAGSLEASLAELDAPARRLLLAASVAQFRPTLAMLAPGAEAILAELAERFLVEVQGDEVIVHDLVREAALAGAAAAELAAAHLEAAARCAEALAHPGAAPLLAIDAAQHLLAAGRAAEAWGVVERWHPTLAAAGGEHLLLPVLERLRAELPDRRLDVDLLVARWHVRAALFEDARRVLAGVGGELDPARAARHALVAGEIAQHAGDLAAAVASFERAATLAPDADTGFAARLRVAGATALGGDGERARTLAAAALAELPAPSPRQRARHALARIVSWMLDERFDIAADEARRARLDLPATGLSDLGNQLAMLETLSAVECEDMEQARAAARRIDETGLRRRVAALYRAIVAFADGEAAAVAEELRAAFADMTAHGDTIHAYLAGSYGSAALAEIGKLGEAQALAARTTQLARRAGLAGPAARSLAHEALLAAEALQCGAVRRLAEAALAAGRVGPRSLARVHWALSRAGTIEADLPAALEHVARARAAVEGLAPAAVRAAIDVEQAAIDLVGGNLDRAVELGEAAAAELRGRSRNYEAARAQLVLAAAYVARGRRTDLLLAERTIAQARELADRARLRSVQVGCAILSAALARRGDREQAAGRLLADALCQLDPERGSIYAGVLLAAIDGGEVARAAPGVVALLAHLGFSDAIDAFLVDARGRRAATGRDVAREQGQRELFVDEQRGLIVARRGAAELRGRPLLCTMLSVLVQAGGAPVTPEVLYRQAWGAAEYHSLQHRNALYVAVNRLRAALRELLPEREVIERAGGGWRLAEGVDACAAVPVRRGAAPPQTM